jgi:hypothetical protein
VEADRGEYLGYVRAVGHRRAGITLNEPIGSIPPSYTKRPLMRGAE